jgi:oxygen-dependent protoporphyrinogen oxidase
MAAELFIGRRGPSVADESIGSFVGRRFGREAVDYLAEPLLAGIHAGDVDRLSMRSLFPRLLEAEAAHGSVLKAFRRLRAGHGGGEGAFRSLRGGIGELVDALTAALPSESVRWSTRPHKALRAKDGWTVDLASGESLCAAPSSSPHPRSSAPTAARRRPRPGGRVRGREYASTVTIAAAYRRDAIQHPLLGSGFVVPRVEPFSIMAGTWVSSKWAHRAPEGTPCCACSWAARAIRRCGPQRRGTRRAGAHRSRAAPGHMGVPLLTRVYRWRRASAQHDVGHLERVAAIDRALQRHRGLLMTGSGFRAPGIPDCVADGRATAASLAQSIHSYSLT